MSDEWDESSEYTAASYTSPSYNDNGGDDGGKSFGGSGRGFSAFITDNDSNGYQGGRGGGRSRGDGRGRGRGGRGGGRGGGGRGGRDGDRGGRDGEWGGGSNNYDNNEESNGYNDGGERRGGFRGGRGGRGGREGGGGDREGNENGEPEKKREQYIPPEPTDDENEMFGSAITSGINFKKYDSIEVNVTGENAPPKIRDFESAGFRPLVLENIKKSGYNVPTPIQKAAIPIIMAERDLMGCAQTGSGKTAAFLLPIINNLLSDPMDIVVEGGCAQPQVVVISPTRELTIQIHSEARKFAHQSILKICIAYGGTVSRHQGDAISRGCHILVATPGRLFDLLERRRLNFASVKFVVLDEADRMLDMGFIKDVEKMMNHPTMTPKEERRTLMFSATFPEEIQRLAHQFLTNFLFVSVGIVGGACSDVEQTFYEVGKYKKREKLVELLQENGDERCMVFVSTKRNADFLAICLSQMNISTTSIHGDRLQSEREMALADFKRGKCPVLVATAVASRGLDIKNVSHVINYDMPTSIDEYVHRIGRTGRVGNKGKASSFFDSSSDNAIAGDLVKILKQAGQNVPDFLEAAGSGGGSYSQNAFGGEDIRSFSTNPGMSVPEEEESW